MSDAAPSLPPAAIATPAEVIAFPTGRYAIAPEDQAEYVRRTKTKRERDRIEMLLHCFRQMESGKITKEAKYMATRLKHLKGFSKGTIINSYYAWLEEGWRGLVRNYGVTTKLPAAFVTYWRAKCEQHPRSIVTALKELYQEWYDGKPVPGYGNDGESAGDWRVWYEREHPLSGIPLVCPRVPEGWGQSNLYELVDQAGRALKTRGFGAARRLLPSMIRDTSKLLPLQLVVIDDFEVDQLAFFHDPARGIRQLCKVTGVAAMDVATRRVIGLIMKPRLVDDEGTKQAITRAEVRLLLFGLLRDHGVPASGMTILAENAAAAVTAELEATFDNLFGGRIQISRTNMIADKVTANGFLERGGMPWLKGWIESHFNKVHNLADALPGQKGANYLVKPGELEAKEQYTNHLIGTGERQARLTDEQVARLRLPFASSDALIAAYIDGIFPALEQRVEHKMQGFEQLRRWRRDDHDTWHEWEELAGLTEAEQLAVEWFPRELRESPRMRWARLFPRVRRTPVETHVLMMLLLTPRKSEVRNRKVCFQHGGAKYAFANRGSRVLLEKDGTEVLVYFDPANPAVAHVCRKDGSYIDDVRSLHVDITNVSAMTEAEKQISEIYRGLQSEVAARPLHVAEDARLAADRAHNAAIVAEGKPGLTRLLAREVDPLPEGAPAHTPTAAAMANAVIASNEAEARQQIEDAATRNLDAAQLMKDRAARQQAQAAKTESDWA